MSNSVTAFIGKPVNPAEPSFWQFRQAVVTEGAVETFSIDNAVHKELPQIVSAASGAWRIATGSARFILKDQPYRVATLRAFDDQDCEFRAIIYPEDAVPGKKLDILTA